MCVNNIALSYSYCCRLSRSCSGTDCAKSLCDSLLHALGSRPLGLSWVPQQEAKGTLPGSETGANPLGTCGRASGDEVRVWATGRRHHKARDLGTGPPAISCSVFLSPWKKDIFCVSPCLPCTPDPWKCCTKCSDQPTLRLFLSIISRKQSHLINFFQETGSMINKKAQPSESLCLQHFRVFLMVKFPLGTPVSCCMQTFC